MTNDVIIAPDNQTSAPAAPERPLNDRLLALTDADLEMMHSQGRIGEALGDSFDNGFNNAFKNIA